MQKYIQLELKQAFFSMGFRVSIVLGLCLAIWQFLLSFLADIPPMGVHPSGVFNQWLGGNFNDLPSYLYFLVLPLIATLPYGTAFYDEESSGFLKNRLLRTSKKTYFVSKYIAVSLSAAVACVIPLMTNFYLTALIFPFIKPIVSTGLHPIFPRSMWANLFYEQPFLYVLGYLVIIFLFSALIASLALVASVVMKNKFAILLTPFTIYMFAYAILNTLGTEQYSPYNFLPPSQPVFYISFHIILLEGIFLLLIGLGFFVLRGIKTDVF